MGKAADGVTASGTSVHFFPPASSGAGGAGGASGLDGISGPPPFLSIDEMMSWLSGQLRKSDDLLRKEMADMGDAKGQAQSLQGAIEMLRAAKMTDGGSSGSGAHNMMDGEAHSLIDGSYKSKSWYQHLSPKAKRLIDDFAATCGQDKTYGVEDLDKEAMFQTCDGPKGMGYPGESYKKLLADGDPRIHMNPDGKSFTVSGDGVAITDKVDDVIKGLGEELQTIQSNNELQMIGLQSQISARANLLQMVSNIVRSFEDTSKGIVGNLR